MKSSANFFEAIFFMATPALSCLAALIMLIINNQATAPVCVVMSALLITATMLILGVLNYMKYFADKTLKKPTKVSYIILLISTLAGNILGMLLFRFASLPPAGFTAMYIFLTLLNISWITQSLICYNKINI